MANDSGSKTEKPTQKKRDDSRKKGLAARSSELPQAVSLVASAMALPLLLPRFIERSGGIWRAAIAPANMTDPAIATGVFGTLLYEALQVFVPLTVIAAVSSTVAQLALTGGRPNPHKLKPQWKNLNPINGVKRLFSMQLVWDLGRTLAKILLMGVLTWTLYRQIAEEALDGSRSLSATLATVAAAMRDLVLRAAALAVVIGVADGLFNRRRFMKQLRMTKREVNDEQKQQQVSPFVKTEMRRRQASLSRSRMMAAVAGADVVITNPTRLAIALKYESGADAPTVVAKGAGHIAKRIRDEARLHGVPTRENKTLARAMYRAVDVGNTIPAEFFAAVAAVLAAVYRARRRRRRAA